MYGVVGDTVHSLRAPYCCWYTHKKTPALYDVTFHIVYIRSLAYILDGHHAHPRCHWLQFDIVVFCYSWMI